MNMARKKREAKPFVAPSEHPELDAWFEAQVSQVRCEQSVVEPGADGGVVPGTRHPPTRREPEAHASSAHESVALAAPSPFALPLMAERFREGLTTEKLKDRLARISRDAAKAADK
jgi:hypothetical protein